MSLLPVGLGSGAGYEIQKSLRFRASASASLSRTPGSTSNRRTWTWSGWVKRGALSGAANYSFFVAGSSTPRDDLRFTNDTLQLFFNDAASASLITTQVFRDPSSHYHLLVSVDTTQATASNRVRLFVNGVQVTVFSTANYPAQNYNTFFNWTTPMYIGARNGADFFDGYLSEINFIDGQALTPTSFGQFDANGVWQPRKYVGTYGTNGFYLPFNDGTSLGNLCLDRSGNGNNWTATNVSLTAGATYDWMDDTPSNNFAVLNPLYANTFRPTLSNANLTATAPGSAGGYVASSTFSLTEGKWYAEFTCVLNEGTFIYPIVGVELISDVNGAPGSSASSAGYWSNGQRYVNGASSAYGASWTNGDVIGMALNLDGSRTVEFFKNNVSQGSISLTTTSTPICVRVGLQGTNEAVALNFGQRPFAYTPPTGFRALCTKNLPLPVIQNPRQHFDVSLWVGNATNRNITGLTFRPDFVWIKNRSGGSESHQVYDVIRGATVNLSTDTTGADNTNATRLTAFNSDGFSLGTGAGVNSNTFTYVGWSMKANGAAVTNTAGTITSQVSANTQAGFSIVTYTGTGANATVGHGLGVAPRMVITKRRNDGALNWHVYHAGLSSAANVIKLSSTEQQTTDAGAWNSTAPTSTVFSLGTSTAANANTGTYVAYCFAEVPGFSRIGSYTGNGSADNAFVWCGFRPAFVMIKCSSTTGNWAIVDARRQGFNVDNDPLFPNLSNAEGTTDLLDITANGFKVRSTNADVGAAQTYVFLAFAESPFSNSRAR